MRSLVTLVVCVALLFLLDYFEAPLVVVFFTAYAAGVIRMGIEAHCA